MQKEIFVSDAWIFIERIFKKICEIFLKIE